MNNNRPKKRKNKNIYKTTKKESQHKASKKEEFSFQEDMIDLISDSEESEQQMIENVNKLQEEVQMHDQSTFAKKIRFSNGKFLIAVNVQQFYNVMIRHEHIGKAQIMTLFERDTLIINGKQLNKMIAYQSFVFQIVQNKNNKSKEKIDRDRLGTNFCQEDEEQLKNFLKNVDLRAQTLIVLNFSLEIVECGMPWENLPSCIQGNESLMIFGLKNTGKSTLADYLLNIQGQNCALLDCDIGRNACMEGCISLTSGQSSQKIWIGEFSPVNNLQTYMRGIRYLFNVYKESWFTKKLVVNTMGYTTGLGQFLIYEIYQIIQPQSIIILQLPNQTNNDNLKNILDNIQRGTYVSKLYMNLSEDVYPCSSKLFYYTNNHAFSKKSNPSRFQKQFEDEGRKINNVCDLIENIRKSRAFKKDKGSFYFKSRSEIQILEQSKHGKENLEGMEAVYYRKLSADENVDMRLIVLGKMVQNSLSPDFNNEGRQSSGLPLFEVACMGFCFQNQIYSSSPLEGLIGIVNEGIDFQKKFYHLNEKQLIDLELRLGRISYLTVGTKGIGTKGVRNNPSKSIL